REMTPRAGGFPYFKISRMNAYLDEVRIHQQNLDQKEVTAQYEYDVANHKDGQFNTGIVVADVEPLPGTKLPQRLQAGEAIYAQECASCHGVNGTGGSSPSLLQCDSCTTLETLSSRISSTMPTYAPLVCQDDCAVEVGRYVLEVLNASTHGEDTRPDEELELSDTQWLRTLYKTTLNLAGRLPHPLEVDMVKDWGETGLDNVMTSLMQEQAFYDRIGEIYNDVFHTDQRANKSVFFVNYFIPGVTEYWADKLTIDNIAKNWARNSTGFGFGREALNLIKYVVKNNRPFTEILTADYAVVNYYTARGYGLDADSMNFRRVPANEIHLEAEIYARKGSEMGDYNFDPRDLKPVKMPELYHGEHAGVLTTPSWIERHPSSATNLNRHRSYMFYKQFLDTDILAIAGMRVDLADEIASAEPTLNNPVCTSCHTIMDPVASTFQWWGNDLVRRVAEDKNRWNQNKILPPGFNGVDMPSNYANTPLVWLAQQAVIDARFARSVAKTLFEGVTGIVPLTEPGADASDELWSAYNTQKNFFKDLANTLRDNGHQIRPIIMAIVKSPYYRDKGHARLLTPEMLDRKLQASTGFSWTDRGYDNRKKLNKFYGGYTTLYGGIDDRRKITDRITDPSSSMTAVQRLMAAEHSCRAISNDFARKKASNRYLMNNVSHTQLPSESAVRSTLVSMQWKLFGDVVKSNDAIIDRYHQLFNSLQSGGVVAINNGDIDERLIGDCRAKIDPDTQQTLDTHVDDDRQFIIRAWMGVLQAMLLDYRFLYE
ncbi:MAG: c-type cytochrome, partial [Pseudomonadales bacterium]|nr:c-type cytochrome [Pseudomonadales bacterium]